MEPSEPETKRSPFLEALGDRVRTLRSRKGMTRRAVAVAADVSERHLANLEYGTGNVSVLVLLQVAQALLERFENPASAQDPVRIDTGFTLIDRAST